MVQLLRKQKKGIYDLLFQAERKNTNKKRKIRKELFQNIGLTKEFFEIGSFEISKLICRGIECKQCIKACPTNALYWNVGEVRIEPDLCIYCGACVLNCIVDRCITVARKRKDGKIEEFSTPREIVLLMNQEAIRRKTETLKLILTKLKKRAS